MIGLPPPWALGLPDKFQSWRPDQEYALDLILNAPTRFVALTMPTGSGKSLVYMAGAHLSGGRAVALTSNKVLQDQLGADFLPIGLYDIRGQGTYPCKALEPDGEFSHLRDEDAPGPIGCDKGPCHAGLKCSLKTAGCTAFDKIRQARKSPLVATNYALWMAQSLYGEGLGDVDLLLLDEAHGAHDELAGALTISLSKWLCHTLDLHPDPAWTIDGWRQWATFHAAKLKGRLDVPISGHSLKEIKYRGWMKQAEQTLWRMSQMDAQNWIEDSTAQAFQFEILHPKAYAERVLWQGAKKVVLVSATLTSKTLDLLGIAPHEVTTWECPSRFPIARRPVWYLPTVQVKWPVTPAQITALTVKMDQILRSRPSVKGIGHTVSYKLGQTLHDKSGEQARLRLHGSGTTASSVVKTFKLSPSPDVLLSPAIDTGVDFPDDECRFQLVFRLPFPSTQSKIVQARAHYDKDYVPYLMVQRLVQSVGRGVRSETDWCETFILDDKWAWARGVYKAMMPQWFRSACKESMVIPPPLVVL